MFPTTYSLQTSYPNFNFAQNQFYYVVPTLQTYNYVFYFDSLLENPSFLGDSIGVERTQHLIQGPKIQEIQMGTDRVEENTPGVRELKKRNRSVNKQVESAKKNSESNIINHVYSFLSNVQMSKKVVERVIKSLKTSSEEIEKACSMFYKIVRLIIFKKGKNYVNKDTMMRYYSKQFLLTQIPNIEAKLEEVGLTLQNLCAIFRITTYYFVKNLSISSIMTSKRITKNSKFQHLKRRRVLTNFIQEARHR